MTQLRGYHRSHSDSLPPSERAYRRAARELRDFHRTRSLDVILEEDGHHHPAAAGIPHTGGSSRSSSNGSGLKKNKRASMCLAEMAVEGSNSVDHDDASQDDDDDDEASSHSDHHHHHPPHSWGHFIEDDHHHDHSGEDHAISRRHLLSSASGRGSCRIGLFHHRSSGREKHPPRGFSGQS